MEYVTSSDKVRRQRKWKPPHTCKNNKCQNVVTPEVVEVLFNEYWELRNRDARVQYVCAGIEAKSTQRSRPILDNSNRRKQISVAYFVDIHCERKKICKSTFLRVFDKTDAFVRRCVANKNRSASGIPFKDSRGKKPPKH